MGRLNLTPLRARPQAIANLEAGRIKNRPVWLDVVADIPPAQVFTRHQPHQHALTKVRTKTIKPPPGSDPQLPPSTTTQVTSTTPSRPRKKASRLYQPLSIRYEEDELRKQFYSDHPWELARPRVVLETSGDNTTFRDYSRGVRSANAALNGESMVQRQLHLLHHVPDISESQAYDIARKEFYACRLREDIERRVAVEEAQAVGADFGKSLNQKSVEIEDRMYEDWERWSKQTVMDNMQKNAAFAGQQLDSGSESQVEGDLVDEVADTKVGEKVFAVQSSKR